MQPNKLMHCCTSVPHLMPAFHRPLATLHDVSSKLGWCVDVKLLSTLESFQYFPLLTHWSPPGSTSTLAGGNSVNSLHQHSFHFHFHQPNDKYATVISGYLLPTFLLCKSPQLTLTLTLGMTVDGLKSNDKEKCPQRP